MEALTPPDLFEGQGLTWYEKKDEAIRLAKEQGKNIFKLVGKPTSPNSKKVIKQLSVEPLKQLLEDSYILWFSSDVSEVPSNTLESDTNLIILPYITVFDPKIPDHVLDVTWGTLAANVERLEEILLTHNTVSNGIIALDNNIIVASNIMQISNRNNNEQIQLFTITGQWVANIRKNDFTVHIDVSRFPKGTLIVCSSTGWNSKIIIQ